MDLLSCFTLEHFVDQVVGKEFECPICYGIMFRIHEVSACGHLFCDSCIAKLEECPLCKGKDLDHRESKYLKRRLENQTVRCYLEKCERTFTLNEARAHLAKEHGLGIATPVEDHGSDSDPDHERQVDPIACDPRTPSRGTPPLRPRRERPRPPCPRRRAIRGTEVSCSSRGHLGWGNRRTLCEPYPHCRLDRVRRGIGSNSRSHEEVDQ